MATRLMDLRNVPDDEIEELRELLSSQQIDFYETEPNRWGISMGAIWLRDDSQRAQARRLLDEYQRSRRAKARADYERGRHEGTTPTLIGAVRRHPIQTLIYVGLAGLVLYLSMWPFLRLGG